MGSFGESTLLTAKLAQMSDGDSEIQPSFITALKRYSRGDGWKKEGGGGEAGAKDKDWRLSVILLEMPSIYFCGYRGVSY